jgi:hypothetical protein
MSKIKTILSLQDLPLGLLTQFDSQLNDLFYHFDGDLYDLERYLTDRQFTIVQVNDEFLILDLEELQLEDYDLTDPKNLLDDADSFTIKEYQKLFSGNVLISSVRGKITELLEIPYDLRIFGDVVIK